MSRWAATDCLSHLPLRYCSQISLNYQQQEAALLRLADVHKHQARLCCSDGRHM